MSLFCLWYDILWLYQQSFILYLSPYLSAFLEKVILIFYANLQFIYAFFWNMFRNKLKLAMSPIYLYRVTYD